jgi:hypothetical protein
LTTEFNTLLSTLQKEETEHTWEQIDKAVKRFHAVVRGGGAKAWPEEFVRGMKEVAVVKGIVRSVSRGCRIAGLAGRSGRGGRGRRVERYERCERWWAAGVQWSISVLEVEP